MRIDHFFCQEQSNASTIGALLTRIGCTEKLRKELLLLLFRYTDARVLNRKLYSIINLAKRCLDHRRFFRVILRIVSKVHNYLLKLVFVYRYKRKIFWLLKRKAVTARQCALL